MKAASSLLLSSPGAFENNQIAHKITPRYKKWKGKGKEIQPGLEGAFRDIGTMLLHLTTTDSEVFESFVGRRNSKTLEEICHLISDFFAQPSKHQFLIYYTGHGITETGDWVFKDQELKFENLLALWLSRPKKFNPDGSPIEEEEHLVIVSDCCFSGVWVAKARSFFEGKAKQDVTVQSACQMWQLAWDLGPGQGGFFSTVWLEKRKAFLAKEKALGMIKERALLNLEKSMVDEDEKKRVIFYCPHKARKQAKQRLEQRERIAREAKEAREAKLAELTQSNLQKTEEQQERRGSFELAEDPLSSDENSHGGSDLDNTKDLDEIAEGEPPKGGLQVEIALENDDDQFIKLLENLDTQSGGKDPATTTLSKMVGRGREIVFSIVTIPCLDGKTEEIFRQIISRFLQKCFQASIDDSKIVAEVLFNHKIYPPSLPFDPSSPLATRMVLARLLSSLHAVIHQMVKLKKLQAKWNCKLRKFHEKKLRESMDQGTLKSSMFPKWRKKNHPSNSQEAGGLQRAQLVKLEKEHKRQIMNAITSQPPFSNSSSSSSSSSPSPFPSPSPDSSPLPSSPPSARSESSDSASISSNESSIPSHLDFYQTSPRPCSFQGQNADEAKKAFDIAITLDETDVVREIANAIFSRDAEVLGKYWEKGEFGDLLEEVFEEEEKVGKIILRLMVEASRKIG